MFFLSTEEVAENQSQAQRYWHFSWRVPAQARCVVHFLTCKGVWPAFRTRNTKYNIWLDKVEYDIYIYTHIPSICCILSFARILQSAWSAWNHYTKNCSCHHFTCKPLLEGFRIFRLVACLFSPPCGGSFPRANEQRRQLANSPSCWRSTWDIGTDSMREVHIWRTALSTKLHHIPSRCANFFLIWEVIKGPRLGFLSMFWTCTPKCGKKCRSLAWP